MNIVIVGHVDHGKSTIIGRLLADTNSLPQGKLEQVKETCRRNSKPFEYAFLLDALKDEQAQGITIDAARVFFKTPKRKYIIIDAPGHIEFLKNMVTGAARAEAALLVIDANEGVMENSKRHGYLLSMLGIKQVVVLVNKMDLIDYNQSRYEQIVEEYQGFLSAIGVVADSFIPVSGFMGDNIADFSGSMHWYNGNTVLEKLDLLENTKDVQNQVFRMPVQGVYKFTAGGDDRRIVAGTIDSGRVKVGDEVIFYPSGKKSKVNSIERFNAPRVEEDTAGSATGFTLEEQIYITRGQLACIIGETQPEVSTRIKTKLFWLGREDLNVNRTYYIKVGTQKVRAELEEVVTVLDASSLASTNRQYVQRHEVAEVIFNLEKEIAFDKAENLTETSRFVIVDNYEIAGGGIVVDSLGSSHHRFGEEESKRKFNGVEGAVTREERAIRYAQKPVLVLISGNKGLDKREIAQYVERRLFTEGRYVNFIEIPQEDTQENTTEFLTRLAQVSTILLNAGNIVIVTVDDLQSSELKMITSFVESKDIKLIGVGSINDLELPIDLHVEESETKEIIYYKVKKVLLDSKVIFDPFIN
ncbi:MAG: GTP-binding protein [Clostridia bacterium]|nr:GTP-binding protein [Clostridia bacterium]